MPKLSISRDDWLQAASMGDLAQLERWHKSGALDIRYDPVRVGVSGGQGRAKIFDVCSPDKENALYRALQSHQVAYAKRLLELGRFPETRTTKGDTALHAAARLSQGADEIIPLLVAQGYNINRVGEQGRTPLLAAIHYKNQAGALALIEAGATVSAIDRGEVPLTRAVAKGFPEVVKALLAHGADPNERKFDSQLGEMPLHYLAILWDLDDTENPQSTNNHLLRMLLEAGADPDAKIQESTGVVFAVAQLFRHGGAQRMREMLADIAAQRIEQTTQPAASAPARAHRL